MSEWVIEERPDSLGAREWVIEERPDSLGAREWVIEERPDSLGARRALGGVGGHFGAPHIHR